MMGGKAAPSAIARAYCSTVSREMPARAWVPPSVLGREVGRETLSGSVGVWKCGGVGASRVQPVSAWKASGSGQVRWPAPTAALAQMAPSGSMRMRRQRELPPRAMRASKVSPMRAISPDLARRGGAMAGMGQLGQPQAWWPQPRALAAQEAHSGPRGLARSWPAASRETPAWQMRGLPSAGARGLWQTAQGRASG